MKSIGNREDTWVWTDKWIVDIEPRYPRSRLRDRNVMLKALNLIHPQMGRCDEVKVQYLFVETDANFILQLKPVITEHDSVCWGLFKIQRVQLAKWL